MAIPLIIGAAAAALPGLAGKGKSGYRAYDFSKTDAYDPNANKFGPHGAQSYAENRGARAAQIDRRTPPTTNYQHAAYAREQGQAARAAQAQAANMMMDRAAGRVPSIAQQQAQRDMNQATAAQASAAASARGPAALALAQQQAANNTANVQGNISGQAQINAANERMQAEQAAFGAQSAIRGQDYGAMGQEAQMAQSDAQLGLASRNANDARAMGYEQMGHQAYGAEQQGKIATQGQLVGSHSAGQGMNASTAMGNANNKGTIESIGDMFSDRRAKYVMSDFTAKQPFDLTAMAPKGGETGGGGGDMSSMMAMLPALKGGGAAMMSDARAKREAYEMGRKDTLDQIKTNPEHGVEVEEAKRRWRERAYMEDPDAKRSIDEVAEEASKNLGEEYRGQDRKQAEIEKKARAYLAQRAAQAKQAATPVASPAPAGAPAPAPSIVDRLRAGLSFSSDFDAKETFDADAPRMQYDPARGWHNPEQADGKSRLLSAMDEQAEKDRQDIAAEQLQQSRDPAVGLERVAALRGGKKPGAMWRQPDEPTAADGQQMAPGTADFLKSEPKPGGAKRPWWAGKDDEDFGAGGQLMAGMKMGGAFSKAQFPSDFSSKEAIDLDDPYETKLAPGEEPAFQAWKKKNAHPMDQGQDYDLRGAYKAGLQPGSDGHWSDRFKKPNHETFSNESQYADAPGAKPGHWEGDRFVAPRTYDLDEPEAIDLDKPAPGATMRDGASDPRTHSFDKNFRRDTPQDQARVKRAFEDRAGAEADRMLASFKARTGADESGVSSKAVASRLKPSDSPVAEANRTMKGSPYVYKPEFTPPDQKPGEPNFGFMAQNLEKSPITATAVKEDPQGMKRVDALKLLRVLGASVADLQAQEDETRTAIAALKGGKKGKR
jgi:hypothetical protein